VSSVDPGQARRAPAVAGSFYPADPAALARLVDRLLADAEARAAAAAADRPGALLGILVPHAGLAYSGAVAATAWRLIARAWPDVGLTVVLLGTNHRAGWLHGVGAWEAGAWLTPLGDVGVDDEVASTIVRLGQPFMVERSAHRGEHSIEVQLPFLQRAARLARIVPLAVSVGVGREAVEAGELLGRAMAGLVDEARPVILAISSDMAHYPDAEHCARVTAQLSPSITRLDPIALAAAEQSLVGRGIPDLACGMCGIEPAVMGLAALRAMGAAGGRVLGTATSADAGGPRDSTVGYLAAGFFRGRAQDVATAIRSPSKVPEPAPSGSPPGPAAP
jgi:AmmeMemoRadiSam system protein B